MNLSVILAKDSVILCGYYSLYRGYYSWINGYYSSYSGYHFFTLGYWNLAWNSGCGYKSRGLTRIVSGSGYYSYYPK